MIYNKLIETLSEIIENDLIFKENLTLVYELNENDHKKLDEHLFYKTDNDGDFNHREVIEINNNNIKIKIIKKS